MILLLLSCQRATAPLETDAERYLRLLSDTTAAVDTLLAECQEIDDWALRGDCSLALARRGTSSGDALTWCQKIEAGLWRDECLFSAAESAAMRDKFELSRELCSHAGTFRQQCNMHTFQLLVATETDIQGDLAAAEEHYATLLAEWAADQEPEVMERMAPAALKRLWTEWFTAVLLARGVIEADGCSVVSAPNQSACLDGAARADKRLRR